MNTLTLLIFWGQSLMVAPGGIVSDLDPARLAVPAQVELWVDGLRITSYDQLPTSPKDGKKHYGPEVAFLEQMTARYPDRHFLAVKYAIGGTCMKDWIPTFRNELETQVNNALAGRAYTPGVVVSEQGECDSRYEQEARLYYSRMTEMISWFRDRWGLSQYILGLCSADLPWSPTVEQAQLNLVRNIDNVWAVSETRLPKLPDNLHFTAAATDRFGVRAARLVNLP